MSLDYTTITVFQVQNTAFLENTLIMSQSMNLNENQQKNSTHHLFEIRNIKLSSDHGDFLLGKY